MADSALTLIWNFAKTKTLAASLGRGPTFAITRTTEKRVYGSSGLLETVAAGEAGFDHTPFTGAASLGLLREEARTQLAADTGDVSDNAVWVPTNMTKGSDSVTDPTGAANTNVRLTAAAGNATLLQTVTSAAHNYIYGVYMKRVTGTGDIDITLDNGVTWATKVLTSEWQRFSATDPAETNPVFGVRIVTNGDAIDFWGSDVNKDKVSLTSHIPNNADSGTVTRNKDDIQTPSIGPNWNDNASTLYFDMSLPNDQLNDATFIDITDGGAGNDRLLFTARPSKNIRVTTASTGGAAGDVLITSNGQELTQLNQSHKVAFAMADSDAELYVDGSRIFTGVQTVDVPTGIDTLHVGQNYLEGSHGSFHMAEIRYYNERKPNQFLEDLSNGLINESAGGNIALQRRRRR